VLVIALSGILSCGNGDGPASPSPLPVVTDPGAIVISGTVSFVSVEGGCWSILSREGKRYEPINLPVEYRRDGLRVGAALKDRNDLASTCLMGSIVEITAIWPD
jgi:hypothetical protein